MIIELTPRARFIVGLVATGAGLAPTALATGVVTSGPAGLSAPRWIVLVAGCVFFLTGWLILLPQRWAKTRSLLGVILLSAFAGVFDWVSLAHGERLFGRGLWIGPVVGFGSTSELTGRVLFAVAAASMSLLALCVWGRWVRWLLEAHSTGSIARDPLSPADSDKDQTALSKSGALP